MQSHSHIGECVLKRLDRFLFSDSSRPRPFQLLSSILSGFYLSDHAPVIAEIKIIGQPLRPSLYKINTKHLHVVALLEKLRLLWEELKLEVLFDSSLAVEKFFQGIKHSKKITWAYGKAKAKAKRLKEHTLQEILAAAQRTLEDAPQSILNQAVLHKAEANLQEF